MKLKLVADWTIFLDFIILYVIVLKICHSDTHTQMCVYMYTYVSISPYSNNASSTHNVDMHPTLSGSWSNFWDIIFQLNTVFYHLELLSFTMPLLTNTPIIPIIAISRQSLKNPQHYNYQSYHPIKTMKINPPVRDLLNNNYLRQIYLRPT